MKPCSQYHKPKHLEHSGAELYQAMISYTLLNICLFLVRVGISKIRYKIYMALFSAMTLYFRVPPSWLKIYFLSKEWQNGNFCE